MQPSSVRIPWKVITTVTTLLITASSGGFVGTRLSNNHTDELDKRISVLEQRTTADESTAAAMQSDIRETRANTIRILEILGEKNYK